MYFTFYTKLMKEYDLKPIEGLIFNFIMGYNINKSDCYHSQDTIAETFNVSRETVNRSVKNLVSKGLITSIPYEKSKTGVKCLAVSKLDSIYGKLQREISKKSTEGVDYSNTVCGKFSHNNKRYKNNYSSIYKESPEEKRMNSFETDYDEFFRLALRRAQKNNGKEAEKVAD